MTGILTSDIFFFITSIAIILITLGFLISIFYLIRILKDASHVVRSVKNKSDSILEDVDEIRAKVKTGEWLQIVMRWFKKINSKKVVRNSKRKK